MRSFFILFTLFITSVLSRPFITSSNSAIWRVNRGGESIADLTVPISVNLVNTKIKKSNGSTASDDSTIMLNSKIAKDIVSRE